MLEPFERGLAHEESSSWVVVHGSGEVASPWCPKPWLWSRFLRVGRFPGIEFRVDDDRGGGWVMDRAMVSFSPVREESLKSYPPNAEVCVNEDAGPSSCEGKSAIPYD